MTKIIFITLGHSSSRFFMHNIVIVPFISVYLFFFCSFQDNVSHDSDTYYILSMISLVALVVCLDYISSENLHQNVESTPSLFNSDYMIRLSSLPSPSVWVPFHGS